MKMAHGIVGSKVRVELKRLSKTKALRTKTQYDLHATKGWRFYAKQVAVIPVDKALVISQPCVNIEWHPRGTVSKPRMQVRP